MDKPSVLLPHALSPAIPIDSPFSIEKLTELDSNQVKITDKELTGMEQTKFKKVLSN